MFSEDNITESENLIIRSFKEIKSGLEIEFKSSYIPSNWIFSIRFLDRLPSKVLEYMEEIILHFSKIGSSA